MSNPQTAEEWKTVAANASAQIADLKAQAAAATAGETAALAAAQAEYDRLLAAAQSKNFGDLTNPDNLKAQLAAAAAVQSFRGKQLVAAKQALLNVEQQYTSQIDQLEQTRANADRQASAALAGPPQTSPNTPPATDKPNTAATDVLPTPVPPVPGVTNPPPEVETTPAVATPTDYPPLSVTPGPLPTWYTDPNATGPVETTATRSLTPAPEPVPPGPVSASETGISIGNQTIDTITPGTGTDAVASVNVSNQVATLAKAKEQTTVANQRRNPNNGDWRVKLRLAPGANYLYNATDPGILKPLKDIGIIFPYTPTIQTTYKANYSSYDLTHSNYKGYYYQGSAVEPVTLSCPFTAQSTVEAEYLLAVIHFFKSVTKMFYGQDAERGTPPPLVYLTGLGEFQFNEHPCVVQSFTYDLPADIDYIRARSPNVNNSNMLNQRQSNNPKGPGTSIGGGILGSILGGAINRLAAAGLPKGGMTKQPAPATFGLNSPTYVPTKMTMNISLLPVQSRKQQSQQFSLKQYANGDLLKGGFW